MLVSIYNRVLFPNNMVLLHVAVLNFFKDKILLSKILFELQWTFFIKEIK